MIGRKRRFSIDKIMIFAATLCFILEVFGKICGAQIALDDLKQETELGKYDSDMDKRAPPGGMWFGPRLGKRSQSPTVDYSQILALQQLLESAIAAENGIAFEPGTKRRYTPRLGRESSEQDIMKNIEFASRFGRELPPLALKELLNAENDVNLSSLYGRAIVDDKRPPSTESKIPPFAPRLGRQLSANTRFYSGASGCGVPAELWTPSNLANSPLMENGRRFARSAEKTKGKIHKT